MGAAAAVAVIIHREKDLVAHFRQAGAVAAASAKSPSELGVHERMAWERLVERAVIREASPGAYYLDEQSWNALRRMRRRMGVVLLTILLLLALAALYLSPR